MIQENPVPPFQPSGSRLEKVLKRLEEVKAILEGGKGSTVNSHKKLVKELSTLNVEFTDLIKQKRFHRQRRFQQLKQKIKNIPLMKFSHRSQCRITGSLIGI